MRVDRQIKIRQLYIYPSFIRYRNAKNAKLKSANFDFRRFSRNPPNIIPANISGYTVLHIHSHHCTSLMPGNYFSVRKPVHSQKPHKLDTRRPDSSGKIHQDNWRPSAYCGPHPPCKLRASGDCLVSSTSWVRIPPEQLFFLRKKSNSGLFGLG